MPYRSFPTVPAPLMRQAKGLLGRAAYALAALSALSALSALGALGLAAQDARPADAGIPAEAADIRYQIAKFDTISVTVFNQADLSGPYRVSETGSIALPLVGDIVLEGLTTREAQSTIRRAFIEQEYLVDPRVTVSIREFSVQTITVLGEVSRPGRVQLPEGTTEIQIQDLIAMVGDFAGVARKNAVRVERPIPGSDESEIFTVDVAAIIEDESNAEAGRTFFLRAGDIVFVPRRVF